MRYIVYDFLKDAHFEELKNLEVLQDRLNILRDVQDYAGKYFSIEYIRKNILGQTEDDIIRIDKEMQYELEMGALNSPGDDPSANPWEGYFEDPDATLTEDVFVEVEEEKTTFNEINNKDEREYKRLMEQIKNELDK